MFFRQSNNGRLPPLPERVKEKREKRDFRVSGWLKARSSLNILDGFDRIESTGVSTKSAMFLCSSESVCFDNLFPDRLGLRQNTGFPLQVALRWQMSPKRIPPFLFRLLPAPPTLICHPYTMIVFGTSLITNQLRPAVGTLFPTRVHLP